MDYLSKTKVYFILKLNSLFFKFKNTRFYKVDPKSIIKFGNDGLFTLDQYFRFYDMANDKNLIPQKDLSQKFKSSFQTIRSLFVHDLVSTNHGEILFELILSQTNSVEQNSAKQTEVNFFF